jgi:hypothetical protein
VAGRRLAWRRFSGGGVYPPYWWGVNEADAFILLGQAVKENGESLRGPRPHDDSFVDCPHWDWTHVARQNEYPSNFFSLVSIFFSVFLLFSNTGKQASSAFPLTRRNRGVPAPQLIAGTPHAMLMVLLSAPHTRSQFCVDRGLERLREICKPKIVPRPSPVEPISTWVAKTTETHLQILLQQVLAGFLLPRPTHQRLEVEVFVLDELQEVLAIGD